MSTHSSAGQRRDCPTYEAGTSPTVSEGFAFGVVKNQSALWLRISRTRLIRQHFEGREVFRYILRVRFVQRTKNHYQVDPWPGKIGVHLKDRGAANLRLHLSPGIIAKCYRFATDELRARRGRCFLGRHLDE